MTVKINLKIHIIRGWEWEGGGGVGGEGGKEEGREERKKNPRLKLWAQVEVTLTCRLLL